MARTRDPRDTEEDPSEDGAGGRDPHAEIRRAIRGVEHRLRANDERTRELELWRVALDGMPGHSGTVAKIEARLDELEAELAAQGAAMKAEVKRLDARCDAQESVVSKLEKVHFKVLAAGVTAGTGAATVAAVILKLLDHVR